MIDFISKATYDFADFVQIVKLLRGPDGCPWDQAQTHRSIRRNFLEEAYECCEAIDRDDPVLMQEELGDVMMQVLFHGDIEAERGRFDLNEVWDGAVKKLIFRHPNVFGGGSGRSWDEMKALEKGQRTRASALDAVARSLPALWRAEKLVNKAGKAGFPRKDGGAALEALARELEELRLAKDTDHEAGLEEALGDVLFAAVCVAAMEGIDPEMALHGTCEKFIARFTAMEQAAEAQGRRLEQCSPEEQLTLWDMAGKGQA